MTANEIWEAALGEIELQISKANFNTWLRCTQALELKGQNLIIGVPSVFNKEGLKKNTLNLF